MRKTMITAVLALSALLIACDGGAQEADYQELESFASLDELRERFDWREGEGGVAVMDVVEGTGREVKSGDWVVAFYTLWDSSGNMLQSNKGSAPFVTFVGVGRLIPGWDANVPGMKDGGVRRLIVPPEMAYGDQPPEGIEPGATLVFELEIALSGTPEQQ